MNNRRPNRWQAARDPSAARRRLSPHHTATPIRSWSLPVTTALRWLFAGVLTLVAVTLFGDVALQAVRGWLA